MERRRTVIAGAVGGAVVAGVVALVAAIGASTGVGPFCRELDRDEIHTAALEADEDPEGVIGELDVEELIAEGPDVAEGCLTRAERHRALDYVRVMRVALTGDESASMDDTAAERDDAGS